MISLEIHILMRWMIFLVTTSLSCLLVIKTTYGWNASGFDINSIPQFSNRKLLWKTTQQLKKTWFMQQLGWISRALCRVKKKTHSKGHRHMIPVAYGITDTNVYRPFLEWQNYRDVEQISGCQLHQGLKGMYDYSLVAWMRPWWWWNSSVSWMRWWLHKSTCVIKWHKYIGIA